MEKTIAKKQIRQFTGLVVSSGMQKTVTVKIDMMKMHSKYQKSYRVSKKYHVHDEKSVAQVGDVVSFKECRPLSKTKRWTLTGVLKK